MFTSLMFHGLANNNDDRRLEALLSGAVVEATLGQVHRQYRPAVQLEDFRQEVCLHAWRKRALLSWRGEQEALAWVRLIARQVAALFHRREHHRPHALPEDLIGAGSSAAEPLELAEQHAALAAALTRLDDLKRDLLERHYHRHQSFALIAKAQGKNVRTIRNRHARTLDKLRQLLIP